MKNVKNTKKSNYSKGENEMKNVKCRKIVGVCIFIGLFFIFMAYFMYESYNLYQKNKESLDNLENIKSRLYDLYIEDNYKVENLEKMEDEVLECSCKKIIQKP